MTTRRRSPSREAQARAQAAAPTAQAVRRHDLRPAHQRHRRDRREAARRQARRRRRGHPRGARRGDRRDLPARPERAARAARHGRRRAPRAPTRQTARRMIVVRRYRGAAVRRRRGVARAGAGRPRSPRGVRAHRPRRVPRRAGPAAPRRPRRARRRGVGERARRSLDSASTGRASGRSCRWPRARRWPTRCASWSASTVGRVRATAGRSALADFDLRLPATPRAQPDAGALRSGARADGHADPAVAGAGGLASGDV